MSYERNRLKGLIKWTRQSESKRRNINDQSMQLSKVAGQRQIHRWVFGEEKTVTTLTDEPLVLMDKQILNAAACRLPPWSVSINPTCVFPSFVIILAGNNSMRTRLPEAALQLVKTKQKHILQFGRASIDGLDSLFYQLDLEPDCEAHQRQRRRLYCFSDTW